MSQKAWFTHFKDQLQGLEELHCNSGSSLSLIAYALLQKRISEEEYLRWAIRHYQVPHLQARFFTERPPSEDIFAKWTGHYRWTEECFPVAEWEGCLIISCIEPPQDFPNLPHPVFVLADFSAMNSYWTSVHTKTEQVDRAETPEGIDLNIAATVGKKTNDAFSIEDLKIDTKSEKSNSGSFSLKDTPEEEESIVPEESQNKLEGLFESPAIVNLQNLSTANPPLTTPTDESNSNLEKTVVLADSRPEPTTPAAKVSPFSAQKPQEELLLLDENAVGSFEPTMIVQPKKTTPQPVESINVEQATVIVANSAAVNVDLPVVKKSIPPPPKAATPPPFDDEDSFVNKPLPAPGISPRPIIGGKANVSNTAGNLALDKWKKKHSSVISEKFSRALQEMKPYFEKSLILTLDENESLAAVFAWDESFNNIKDTSSRIPLKTPSIFNIVAATQKPYHGYISINEVNEKFFEDWNHGRIPDHVTIMPIIVEEKIVGMLMGIGEKSAYNKMALNSAEKLSIDLSIQLSNLKVA